jgi:hypothetical protein
VCVDVRMYVCVCLSVFLQMCAILWLCESTHTHTLTHTDTDTETNTLLHSYVKLRYCHKRKQPGNPLSSLKKKSVRACWCVCVTSTLLFLLFVKCVCERERERERKKECEGVVCTHNNRVVFMCTYTQEHANTQQKRENNKYTTAGMNT